MLSELEMVKESDGGKLSLLEQTGAGTAALVKVDSRVEIMEAKTGAQVEYYDIADDGDEEGQNNGSSPELLHTGTLALGSSSTGVKERVQGGGVFVVHEQDPVGVDGMIRGAWCHVRPVEETHSRMREYAGESRSTEVSSGSRS